MLEQVLAQAAHSEVFISVAAVADWRPAAVSATKLKKTPGQSPPPLALALNPDILATVAALPAPPLCVGFAAESDQLVEHARQKLARKGVALIVANQVDRTLGADDSQIVLVDAQGARPLARASKLVQGRRIVAAIAQLLAPAATAGA